MRLLTAFFSLALASSGAAQTVVPVGPFRSVELRHGGHVVVRHGPAPRVTILGDEVRCTRIEVDDRQRLVIDNGGRGCRHHGRLRLQIEVITPGISALAVSNGGTLQSAGAFPAQDTIAAAVEQGGTVDIRSIPADAVAAAVDSGGRIFTHARGTLSAAIRSGGAVMYWGDARVTKSVRDGGVVRRGRPEQAGSPLSELSTVSPPVPVIPAH